MIHTENHFSNPVYFANFSEFLLNSTIAFEKHINRTKSEEANIDELYPIHQSYNFYDDPLVFDLASFITKVSWDFLYQQGYDMDKFQTYVISLWAQEHEYNSGHVEHVHALGSQISGFYIIDAPKDGSYLVVCDPRPGKKQISLPLRDNKQLSTASDKVYFTPEPGNIYFFNSWLPHEISRNRSKQPFKLIHFNVGIMDFIDPSSVCNQVSKSNVEIV